MYRIIISFWLAFLLTQASVADSRPHVVLETNYGNLELILEPDLAPVTVKKLSRLCP